VGAVSEGDDESPDSAFSGCGLAGLGLSAFHSTFGGASFRVGAGREIPAPFDGQAWPDSEPRHESPAQSANE